MAGAVQADVVSAEHCPVGVFLIRLITLFLSGHCQLGLKKEMLFLVIRERRGGTPLTACQKCIGGPLAPRSDKPYFAPRGQRIMKCSVQTFLIPTQTVYIYIYINIYICIYVIYIYIYICIYINTPSKFLIFKFGLETSYTRPARG